MKPRRKDVEEMVGALMASRNEIDRASRKGEASRLMALFTIGAVPASSPKAISAMLGMHASSVTRLIQAFEDDGLVEVTADRQDRRSCRLSLTELGRAEVARLREVGMARFASFVADWEAAEVRELTRLLRKLEQSKAESAAGAAEPPRAGWRRKSPAPRRAG